MGRTKMSEEQFMENRKSILNAALTILIEKGIDDVSARKVATALNMTATNIYNYYENKDELLFAMQNYGFEMLYNLIEESHQPSQTPLENIRNFINTYLSFAIDHSKIYALMFGDYFQKYHQFASKSNHFKSYFIDYTTNKLKFPETTFNTIDQAKKNNPRIANDDTNKLILKLFSAAHGFIVLYNNGVLSSIVPNEIEFLKENVDYLIKPFEHYESA